MSNSNLKRTGDENVKYAPLGLFLRSQGMSVSELLLTLAEIEQLVGQLPASAKTPQFWSNAKRHQHTRRGQWLDAGFEAYFEPGQHAVRFKRASLPPAIEGEVGASWTLDELRACVTAYRQLLAAEERGEQPNKSLMRREVLESKLQRRSDGSYEFRMQNISAVLVELGLPYLSGYQPLKNIGSPKASLIALVNEIWDRNATFEMPTDNIDALETRIASARQKMRASKGVNSPPPGAPVSARASTTTFRFMRDPNVIAWVLETANGVCEICDTQAPFLRSNGEPYLEVHHVLPLAGGGPDTTDNTVAACPNCHRQLHYGDNNGRLVRKIISKIERIIDYRGRAVTGLTRRSSDE